MTIWSFRLVRWSEIPSRNEEIIAGCSGIAPLALSMWNFNHPIFWLDVLSKKMLQEFLSIREDLIVMRELSRVIQIIVCLERASSRLDCNESVLL